MSKNVSVYTLDDLSEDTVIESLKKFYTTNANEPREISVTQQAYNAIYPYHKQQIRSIRGVPLTITADRIAPLVIIS